MFFSITTKNSNWEILTKNLVTFKRQNGVNDEKPMTKNQYRGGNCLKSVYEERKRGVVF